MVLNSPGNEKQLFPCHCVCTIIELLFVGFIVIISNHAYQRMFTCMNNTTGVKYMNRSTLFGAPEFIRQWNSCYRNVNVK